MIVYGPVSSRRLGRSIGINNIPPKTCSYSCVYCQLGHTDRMRAIRQEFYNPQNVCREAEIKIGQLASEGENADYFTFVPDGEPTLDRNLGLEIGLLKQFGIKTAVITNASLIWRDDVKEDLMKADWVSLKIDAADDAVWRKIDRPHGSLRLGDILDGIVEFSREYKGVLVTETMLVKGINDDKDTLVRISDRLAMISPDKAYLLAPTRPPACGFVNRPSTKTLENAFGIIRSITGIEVECITGDESEEGFFVTEDIADDLLGIASVHPIREDIAESLLKRRNADGDTIRRLIDRGAIIEYMYEGRKFYKRNIHADGSH